MLDEETDLAKCYEKIKERWLMLIAGVYSDSGENPKSIKEAIVVLDNHPEAKAVFEKKMADVRDKVKLALSDVEDILQLVEQQINKLPDDDRPTIKKLKQHMIEID